LHVTIQYYIIVNKIVTIAHDQGKLEFYKTK